MLDGLTGEISWIDSVGSMHFSSSSAFDANGDGRDEVLFSVNYISSHFSHQLKMVDFQNDSIIDITSLNAGVNLGCSPLIADLDEDGLVELFILTSTIVLIQAPGMVFILIGRIPILVIQKED